MARQLQCFSLPFIACRLIVDYSIEFIIQRELWRMAVDVVSELCIEWLGTLYPAYCSYKAMRNRDNVAHLRWLRYWVCYALFVFVTTITDLFLFWVPFYFYAKTAAILFLIFNDSAVNFVYASLIHPTLNANGAKIDTVIENAQSGVVQVVSKVGRVVLSSTNTYASHIFKFLIVEDVNEEGKEGDGVIDYENNGDDDDDDNGDGAGF
eukprot:m.32935 g.32935  ORF g.32935 m.32935 type:complete len:208 (+) comp6422_c0_seq1:15-638(+)